MGGSCARGDGAARADDGGVSNDRGVGVMRDTAAKGVLVTTSVSARMSCVMKRAGKGAVKVAYATMYLCEGIKLSLQRLHCLLALASAFALRQLRSKHRHTAP